ncbi:MAG TPA: enoyl-CoA hydratase/isomerase family protein, partial [Steroidobacteraceae bacterium]|nr:enoyl-CoA hydratase/isomerase family protein [Steroidobacteraceae bacterium]
MPESPEGGAVALQSWRSRFPSLQFESPAPAILEIVICSPARLNAADAHTHRDLAQIWREIDTDETVRAVLVRGAGKHFSAGGDFSLIEDMIASEATLVRVWKEASDLVYNLINCS